MRIGYYDDVHVVYRVHDDNSSASASNASAERFLPIFEEQVAGLDQVRADVGLPRGALRVLERQLANMYFWRLGYAGHKPLGHRAEALRAFRRGLRLAPLNLRMWKTLVLYWLRR